MNAAPDPAERSAAIDRAPTKVGVRSGRIVRWCVSVAVAVSLTVPAALLTWSALSGDQPAAALLVVVVLWDAAMAIVLGWLVVVLPQHWTAQGVDVDVQGLTFTARSRWWFRGRHAELPWTDVVAVGRGTRTAGRGFGVSPAALLDRLTSLGRERTLELYVRTLPAPASLPSWALPIAAPDLTMPARITLVLADEQRIQVEQAVRGAIGDVRPPTSSDGAAPWVSLRGVGIVPHRFSMTGLTLLIAGLVAASALVYGVVDGVARGFGPGHVSLAVLAPCGLPVLAWLGYRLPRFVTRQGVAADQHGITLNQEPKWWFSGATVRIPWADVRSIDEDVLVTGDAKNRRSQFVIDVRLKQRVPGGPLPSWVDTKSRRDEKTALVLFPGRRHGRVLATLRAARPG